MERESNMHPVLIKRILSFLSGLVYDIAVITFEAVCGLGIMLWQGFIGILGVALFSMAAMGIIGIAVGLYKYSEQTYSDSIYREYRIQSTRSKDGFKDWLSKKPLTAKTLAMYMSCSVFELESCSNKNIDEYIKKNSKRDRREYDEYMRDVAVSLKNQFKIPLE